MLHIFLFLIMLALCLMLSVTHYAQNYAGIIGGSLKVITVEVNVHIVHKLSLSYYHHVYTTHEYR